MAAPLTRILSDLHYGDERSRLRDLAALAPLLDGVDTLVLNGDCCHTQAGAVPETITALRAFFANCGRPVIYLTGNHDPDLSNAPWSPRAATSDIPPRHELSLADGRVWVTHGDVIFDAIAPWCHLREEITRRLALIRGRHSSAEWESIPSRLEMMREACRDLPSEVLPAEHSVTQRLARLARDLWPPRRLVSMLHTWTVAPGRAAHLAAAQRPAAQVVVMGHIHFPGVWWREGRTCVNTGAFTRPLGALLVDIAGDRVFVRRVVAQAGAFHPGRTVAEIALAPSAPAPTLIRT